MKTKPESASVSKSNPLGADPADITIKMSSEDFLKMFNSELTQILLMNEINYLLLLSMLTRHGFSSPLRPSMLIVVFNTFG